MKIIKQISVLMGLGLFSFSVLEIVKQIYPITIPGWFGFCLSISYGMVLLGLPINWEK